MNAGVPGWVVWAVAAVVAVLAFDRVALAMERRGWIYWRRTKRRYGTDLGNAFLEVESLVDPSKRHVLEVRRDEHAEEDDGGDPPEPGRPPRI